MRELSWAKTRQLVYERANNCCEYCQTCQAIIGQAMHVEHIIPDGGNDLENLCLACATCNLSKAQAIAVHDSETNQQVPLFNPRKQQWSDHFRWIDRGTRVQGLTPVGRVTIERLRMNLERLIIARSLWARAGAHPPKFSE